MNIAVSMGDPSGIGPEIAIKAWLECHNDANLKYTIFGDYGILSHYGKIHGVKVSKLEKPNQEFDFSKELAVFEPCQLGETPLIGMPQAKNAAAIINYIESATNAVIAGEFSAITTLPISKSPLYEAGFKFKGHTEFVASLCEKMPYDSARGPIMMLMIDGLRAALATIHIAISEVAKSLSPNELLHIIKVVDNALKQDFGIKNPKIAILGLNPHAGEDGNMGREEIEIINPVCEIARQNGIDCTNALPADSAFSSFNRQKYDAYIAMYHDQGLIPIKALDFWGGVNVTLGLPIIRTSPDHGTAYEIAGKNIAHVQSFINALKAANQIAYNRNNI